MTVSRLRPFGETIFATMSQLAADHDAINLGQGYPDWDGPEAVLKEAQNQIAAGNNQYGPGRGMKVLRDAVVADRARRTGQTYDADTECLITVGATEAIAATALGHLEPGSHVIIIEPYYDAYKAAIALANATYTAVPLVPQDTGDTKRWALDRDALNKAITDNTAMIIINSPHNPTGAVLTREDLQAIADVVKRENLLVLSDEVYEHLYFDGHSHQSISQLPGMRERTIVVSSAAKTLNVTGWKTGWALAPAELLDGVVKAKQFLTYVGATPFQSAVARGLTECSDWIAGLAGQLGRSMRTLREGLESLGADVYPAQAGYFVVADVSSWGLGDALKTCTRLATEAKVAAIPVTAFVDNPESDTYRYLVRFAFCKRPEILAEAIERLRSYLAEQPAAGESGLTAE
ncbi:MAG: aminotransferase class I/II-fold pyridoxal phosphate-dependent enzyme [Corynebacterium sp.]|uniref:aminotransferase class I/II-fold pyridoxal phosphate-dependent enzyme n=1 Tax=Corynebacterium sp. TaxID=1720 RepID=UPI0026DCF51F|nr:aminotransferase class I/II-fold pyridoxal phosphate-dependent enzyme [Corynebacterium sp.]MDO5029541.1 aminotransferase class I/II-fold pyridoxal phosphate-dependent enzyme [Corynebacterium sp.]